MSQFGGRFNAWEQPIDFTLPGPAWSTRWSVVLDTSLDLPPRPGTEYKAGDTLASIANRADPAHATSMTGQLARETGSGSVVPGEHIFIP